MIILDCLLAAYWVALLIALFFGFEPSTFTVGAAFIISALAFLLLAEIKKERKS